jgi:hypothetical protein
MSNESENERIDLTQFEGITEGPWDMHYDESALDDQEHLEYGAQLTPVGTLNEMARVDAHAIGKVPDLIAELKRCYEQENEHLMVQAQAVVDLMELWKVSDTGRNEKSSRVINIVCEELLRIARSIAERKASE